MKEPELPNIPEPDSSDIAYGIGRAILSLIPLPVASIAEMMIRSPMDRRVDNWRRELTVIVDFLRKRLDEVELKALQHNEEFATTFLHATRAAVSTHRKEKHEMLRNVIVNSALPNAPEDDERTVFLNLIEEFTVAHIHILKAFKFPPDDEYFLPFSLEDSNWRENLALGQLYNFVQRVNSETVIDYHLFITILPDLHNRGLISNILSERNILSELKHQPTLTTFGRRFLKFIEFPLDD